MAVFVFVNKLQECRLRSYGRGLRQPITNVGNKCLTMPTLPRSDKDDTRASKFTATDVESQATWRKQRRKADPELKRVGHGLQLANL